MERSGASFHVQSSEMEHSKDIRLDEGDGEKWSYVVFTFIIFLSVLVNLRVLFIVVNMPILKRRRPASVLVAHLSAVAIIFTFVCLLILADTVDFIDLGLMKMCEVIAYLKTVIFCAFSLNVTGIIYERIRTFRETLGTLLVYRMICLIWLVSLVVSVPAVFMNESQDEMVSSGRGINVGSCKSILLFQSKVATLIYELARLVLFHVGVVGYKVHALLKIRSNLKYLYFLKPIPNERMRRKVHSIRFIYIHFITFISIWLPVGLLVFAHRTLSRVLNKSMHNATESAEYKASPAGTALNRCFGFLIFIYFILNPMIYLLLIENVIWPRCCMSVAIRNGGNLSTDRKENEVVETISRVSTVGITTEINMYGNGSEIVGGNCVKQEDSNMRKAAIISCEHEFSEFEEQFLETTV